MKHNTQQKGGITIIFLVVLSLGISVLFSGCTHPTVYTLRCPYINVLCSGINQSGLIACPWYVNESSSELLGRNEAFRSYFEVEIKNASETHYPGFFDQDAFTFDYDKSYNFFKEQYQIYIPDEASNFEFPFSYDPSEFDPYLVDVNIEVTNTTYWDTWNDTISVEIVQVLREKWYIEDALVPYERTLEKNVAFTPNVNTLVSLNQCHVKQIHVRKIKVS